MDHPPDRFAAALDRLVSEIKADRSILAAILCGSLSHDTVWAKSDVDLVLVTIDDRLVTESHVSLYADGVNVHALIFPRAKFRKAVDRFVAGRAPTLFAPVLEYLRDAGEARSATEIETYFVRHFGIEGVTTACEYLADQGLVGKASLPVRATKKSTVSLQELAFFDLGEPERA